MKNANSGQIAFVRIILFEDKLSISFPFSDQLGGYATGILVRPLAKVTDGIKDAVTGETEYPIRRSLGYSPSVVGEK